MKVNATATRQGDMWAIEVSDLPALLAQASDLSQAPDIVRDAVALMLDLPPRYITVSVDASPIPR